MFPQIGVLSQPTWLRRIMSIETPDWSQIPAPQDDGAARHLVGMPIASVPLPATDGTTVHLSSLRGTVVVYAYPRTGRPGIENPAGWDLIPGARGCAPQSCSFRDHFAELRGLGVIHLFGLSTQDTLYQRGSGASALAISAPVGRKSHLSLRDAPADL